MNNPKDQYIDKDSTAIVMFEKLGNFKVHHLSEGWLSFQSETPMSVDNEVEFTLNILEIGETLKMKGIVTSQKNKRNKPFYILEYVRMNPSHHRLIVQYLIDQIINRAS